MKTTVLLGLAIAFGGCGITGGYSPYERTMLDVDNGHILIDTDAEGMRALGDTMSGMINVGKTSPDVRPTWYDTREKLEGIRRGSRFERKQAEGQAMGMPVGGIK